MFGLSAISYDLLVKYPDIAKDYLSVEVDTGLYYSLLCTVGNIQWQFVIYLLQLSLK
jgi:uncharacterized integral membrane protein